MKPFDLPENLDELSVAELQALIDAGLDAFNALEISESSPDEVLVEGERIAPLITRAQEAKRVADARAVTRRDRAAHLVQSIQDSKEVEPAKPVPVPNSPNEDPHERQERPTERSTEQPQPQQQETAPEPVAEVETVQPDQVLQPVSAAGSPARRAAAHAAPVPVPPRRGTVTLTAAADVPGIPTGAELDGLDAVCAAVLSRMRGLPTAPMGDQPVRHRYGAATIRLDGFDDLSQTVTHDDYALVQKAGSEFRLPGNSLVAAGGWCAPSETLYDLCQFESVDGILSVPEINVSRGGIRFTPGPDFADIYNDCGFQLTEAEAIAGTATKDCCEVECPPFEEIRLDAIGLCVKTPLLTNAAYPELVRRFMEGALVAHAHKVNKYMLTAINAAAGAGVTLGDAGSVSVTLQQLEMLAVGMRYQYRMSQTATIEVVAPFWLLVLLRSDLGMRQGRNADVTDAEVNAWFSARNMSVQWVYDFQDLVTTNCAPDVPDTAQLLMYPAGTWVKGSLDVINIDAVYDSVGLAENTFTALFTEQGVLAVQRCTHTCKVTVPLCVSGRVGAADLGCIPWPGQTVTP